MKHSAAAFWVFVYFVPIFSILQLFFHKIPFLSHFLIPPLPPHLFVIDFTYFHPFPDSLASHTIRRSRIAARILRVKIQISNSLRLLLFRSLSVYTWHFYPFILSHHTAHKTPSLFPCWRKTYDVEKSMAAMAVLSAIFFSETTTTFSHFSMLPSPLFSSINEGKFLPFT